MKSRLLIITVISIITIGSVVYTSGVFTPLQSDLSECYYTDDESNVPKPCMIIDGWYDALLQSTIQPVNNSCGEEYLISGNNECVLNPEFIEPNTIIIYDVPEISGTRLAVAPHQIVMNLTNGNTVTFVNDGLTPVNILIIQKEFGVLMMYNHLLREH